MSEPCILVYVVRHGRTTLNEENVFRGDANPALNKDGYKDAHTLAKYFEPIEISYVFSTGKKRADETARIICKDKVCGSFVNEGLQPWNIGDFGGLEKNDENIEKLQHYIKNPDKPVPGGTSLNEFRSRVRPLLRSAVELALESCSPVLLVVHSSVIHEVGEEFGKTHEDAHVKPGGVSAIFIRDGKLGVEPIFKPDERSTTQNVLGTKRSGMTS